MIPNLGWSESSSGLGVTLLISTPQRRLTIGDPLGLEAYLVGWVVGGGGRELTSRPSCGT